MPRASSDTRTEGPVTVAELDGVRLVTLNRPAARNAIDVGLSEGFAAALAELDAREDLTAAVVTGASGTFCAGMDLKAFAGVDRATVEQALARMVRWTARKPVIAAVEGFAVGGGCELALACDLIVCARDARLGVPEVRHGLVPAGGALMRLPQRLPFGVVMEMALTGDLLDAERLHVLGLVNRLADPGHAVDVAVELARSVVANAPLAVAASKRLLWNQRDWPAEEAWDNQDAVVRGVNASEDAREGIRAFAERRPPQWSGA
jgi:enoyl-CoA hydratase